jgi:hypothetical protein
MGSPTEFAFVLPRGYCDAAGGIHREGAMRLATAADEILPLQDFRVKSNRAYLVVLLLTRVVTRLGPLSGDEITPAVIEALYSPDLAYLQEFYRHINEAGTASVDARCPVCGTTLQVDVGTRTATQIAS